MNNLADADKTKPISPGLKRQLYRIYSSTHLLVNPSAARNPADAQESRSKLHSKSVANRQEICQYATLSSKIYTSSNSVYCPPPPTPPLLCPSKPPILTLKFS